MMIEKLKGIGRVSQKLKKRGRGMTLWLIWPHPRLAFSYIQVKSHGMGLVRSSSSPLQELTNGLQAEEDKANRLGKLKTKLENTIAETNDELGREKRQRGDLEKVRRKVEADLKVS